MSEPDEMSQDGLTKLVALKVSIKIWSHIEAKGVGKRAAIEALGINSSDYLFQCPAWLEFSAADNPRLDGDDDDDDDDDYPCVRNPNSPYYRYPGMHPQSLESNIYKQVGHDMVKLLEEAYKRNLNESRLNCSMFD